MWGAILQDARRPAPDAIFVDSPATISAPVSALRLSLIGQYAHGPQFVPAIRIVRDPVPAVRHVKKAEYIPPAARILRRPAAVEYPVKKRLDSRNRICWPLKT